MDGNGFRPSHQNTAGEQKAQDWNDDRPQAVDVRNRIKRVSRPRSLAVESPKKLATQPWAYS